MEGLIRGVVFDAFGTLVQIGEGTHPYRQLLKIGRKNGRRPMPSDIHRIMNSPLVLAKAAKAFGITTDAAELSAIEADLARELASIKAHEDGLYAVQKLLDAGIKVGICSNLGMPYVEPVKRLYPGLSYSMSCEVGDMKPSLRIYQHACDQLGLQTFEVAMIGDSLRCDKQGPDVFGLRGYFLDRNAGLGDYSNLRDFADDMVRRHAG